MKIKNLAVILMFFSFAVLAFANGQQESSKVTVTGTVVSMVNTADGDVTVTFTSDGKTYTVNISKEEQTTLKLAVGKDITVNGSILNDNNSDGTVELEANDLLDIESGEKVSVGDSITDMKSQPEKKEQKEAPEKKEQKEAPEKPDSDSDD